MIANALTGGYLKYYRDRLEAQEDKLDRLSRQVDNLTCRLGREHDRRQIAILRAEEHALKKGRD